MNKNPKSEYRNSKQYQKFEIQNTKYQFENGIHFYHAGEKD
jgi:hypothetical protein